VSENSFYRRTICWFYTLGVVSDFKLDLVSSLKVKNKTFIVIFKTNGKNKNVRKNRDFYVKPVITWQHFEDILSWYLADPWY